MRPHLFLSRSILLRLPVSKSSLKKKSPKVCSELQLPPLVCSVTPNPPRKLQLFLGSLSPNPQALLYSAASSQVVQICLGSSPPQRPQQGQVSLTSLVTQRRPKKHCSVIVSHLAPVSHQLRVLYSAARLHCLAAVTPHLDTLFLVRHQTCLLKRKRKVQMKMKMLMATLRLRMKRLCTLSAVKKWSCRKVLRYRNLHTPELSR